MCVKIRNKLLFFKKECVRIKHKQKGILYHMCNVCYELGQNKVTGVLT